MRVQRESGEGPKRVRRERLQRESKRVQRESVEGPERVRRQSKVSQETVQ